MSGIIKGFGVFEQFEGSSNAVSLTNKDLGFDASGEDCCLQVKEDVENHNYIDGSIKVEKQSGPFNETAPETVWVEGLVPGIDFCNHGRSFY